MAKVKLEEAQGLVDQINGLEKSIKTAGDAGRAKLGDIKVGEVRQGLEVNAAGKLDEDKWNARDEESQNKLRERLVQVRDSLQLAAELDGPTDPKHIMYGAYASNNAIICCTVVGFLLTVVLLYAIVQR